MNRFLIESNSFEENYSGYSKGMITLVGATKLYITLLEFKANGENCKDIFDTLNVYQTDYTLLHTSSTLALSISQIT